MKKKTISLMVLCLLFLNLMQAQNYRVITDSIFDAQNEVIHQLPTPSYRICADSLIKYVNRYYDGKCIYTTSYRQVSAPVSGSDEKLRMVIAHIIGELSHFPQLQQYSERIDDGTSLRGRYIAKLHPEGNDTSAYVFLKYDRNLLVLIQSSNDNLKSTAKTTATDESLSLWRKLRDDFYGTSIISNCNVQVKFEFRRYIPGSAAIYLTNPAPANGSKMKYELIRIDDKYTHIFRSFRDYMELAGREEGTVNGLLHNSGTLIPDTCKYYYACHTFPDGLTEFIGVTHEDSITYLTHATSEMPGLVVNSWGKYDWMTEEESKALWKDKYAQLGIWVYDADTKKSLSTAKITTLDSEGNIIDFRTPRVQTPWKDEPFYRYVCTVPKRDYYKIKVEAEGYETGYGEIQITQGEEPKQIEVYLKPTHKKGYVISGVIDNYDRPEILRVKDGEPAFLLFANSEKIEVPIKDGKFQIEGYVDHPTECFLGVGGPAMSIILDNANYWVTLTFYKGEGASGKNVLKNEMKITSDSELFNTYWYWYDMDGKFHTELRKYVRKISSCSPDSVDYYKNKADSIKNEMDSVSLSTARNHPNKYLLPFVLSRQFDFSYERLWKEYETIPDSIKATPIGREVRKRLLKSKEQKK